MTRQIPYAEVQQHKTETDLWLLIGGKGALGADSVRRDQVRERAPRR